MCNEEKIRIYKIFFFAKKKYRIINQKLINMMTCNESGGQEISGSEVLLTIPFYAIFEINYVNSSHIQS